MKLDTIFTAKPYTSPTWFRVSKVMTRRMRAFKSIVQERSLDRYSKKGQKLSGFSGAN
jgi:hypothetical protein